MQPKRATIVTDLGFGDAGKGTIVDFLARRGGVAAVVRYNGGGQAAHNVITPDGRHHTFRQFGSGAFVPGVRTYLSRFMLVDPLTLCHEAMQLKAAGCREPLKQLSIDNDAIVVTPLHKSANLLRERLRSQNAHGTCGMGIGETMAHFIAYPGEAIRVADLRNQPVLLKKVLRLQERLNEEFKFSLREQAELSPESLEVFYDDLLIRDWVAGTVDFSSALHLCDIRHLAQLAREGNLLFEGAQGVLLDEWYGFHPHTTWSTTTSANALTLLNEIDYVGDIKKLGVLRAYHTRHGAGPFATEDTTLTQLLKDDHNENDGAQGLFRSGWFDMVMARYALSVTGGVDTLAITNLDRFFSLSERKVCTAYRFDMSTISSEEHSAFVDPLQNGREVRVKGFKKKYNLTDLAYQEMLTRLLSRAFPLYHRVGGDSEEYLHVIEDALGVPISLTSFGPTASEKQFRALN